MTDHAQPISTQVAAAREPSLLSRGAVAHAAGHPAKSFALLRACDEAAPLWMPLISIQALSPTCTTR